MSLFQAYAVTCQDCDSVFVFLLVVFLSFHMTELNMTLLVSDLLCAPGPHVSITWPCVTYGAITINHSQILSAMALCSREEGLENPD